MTNVNFQVQNALALISPCLAAQYEKNGFNPFEEGFTLSASQAEKLLALNEKKHALETPQFLSLPTSDVARILRTARRRTQKLETLLAEFAVQNAQPEILDQTVVLKIIMKILESLSLKNLSYEEILDAYKTILTTSGDYSALTKKLFDKQFNHALAVQEFARLVEANSHSVIEPPVKADLSLSGLVHGAKKVEEKSFSQSPTAPQKQQTQKREETLQK